MSYRLLDPDEVLLPGDQVAYLTGSFSHPLDWKDLQGDRLGANACGGTYRRAMEPVVLKPAANPYDTTSEHAKAPAMATWPPDRLPHELERTVPLRHGETIRVGDWFWHGKNNKEGHWAPLGIDSAVVGSSVYGARCCFYRRMVP